MRHVGDASVYLIGQTLIVIHESIGSHERDKVAREDLIRLNLSILTVQKLQTDGGSLGDVVEYVRSV